MIPLTSDSMKKANEKYEMFTSFVDDVPEGKTFSAKDNLTAIGMETCAGSMILKGYRPLFDATAISRMREAASLIGKTNMDEFGFGSFSVNSAFGIPKNPFDRERSCGGSSGGSACAAAVFEDHISLGVSTGGSISCPAAFCGIYGMTPTYGRVSRQGLLDYGNSLDKVGVLAADADDIWNVMSRISGKDPKDPTSCVQPELKRSASMVKSVAVPKDSLDGVSKAVAEAFDDGLEMLRSMGVDIDYVDIPAFKFAVPAYYIIGSSEASTNLARYCGMRYGQQDGDLTLRFDDYFSYFRSKYFGKETKRRLLLGTYARMAGFRDKYYTKALQVRELVINEYKKVFEDHDAVLTPTMPFISPKFDEISKMSTLDIYCADRLTIPANLSGMPHLSVPCGYSDGLPIGMQFVSDHWNESLLIKTAEEWDSSFETKRAEVVL